MESSSTMQQPCCCSSFNGATAGMPWKDGSRWRGSRSSCSFNGATAGMPWKGLDPCVSGPTQSASMGPRRECRGKKAALIFSRVSGVLQWGHGGNAVESRDRQNLAQPPSDASMGPRRECRGKSAISRWTGGAFSCFNGATAGMPWKVDNNRLHRADFRCFNGATAGMPWKGRWICRVEPPIKRFNGATAGMPWKADLFHAILTGAVSFNGATAGMPWKARRTPRLLAHHHASMGPRRECRGKTALGAPMIDATALQWGHGGNAVESRVPAQAATR